ncbi:hypothetical protein BO85DRAFT_472555 [Aspergillus piperis CBS 112811]|uniref:Uncharacterized protein n=1 Tax=Aspergillus piperis CBS 112811 TaxID=1448313 RepID=A0A8G1VGR4_9EURO|nr:hypothetical protein BO85DRAFT_472555 [Aspergillus piperis CBS 112811]RAH52551.1 hypothetical protein BO85DRAFT_472555 [Aspergillus piperis CBS 112811]
MVQPSLYYWYQLQKLTYRICHSNTHPSGQNGLLVLISNANTPDENKCCEPTVAFEDLTIPSFEQDNKQDLTRTRMIEGLPRQSSLGHHFRNAGAKFRGIQDVRAHVQGRYAVRPLAFLTAYGNEPQQAQQQEILVDPNGSLIISLADSSSTFS